MKSTKILLGLLLVFLSGLLHAEADFSGNWVLNSGKGENLGMVAAVDQTLVVTQTGTQLKLDYTNIFQGAKSKRVVTLDLTGAEVDNPAAMGDPSKTVSKWDGRNLVTTWSTEGAIPGTSVTRIETISLVDDGDSMSITTKRENRPTMILVYDKQS